MTAYPKSAKNATIPPNNRGFTRTSFTFLLDFLRRCTYVECVCAGLILDATVGWRRQSAHISNYQFRLVANVSRRAVDTALAALHAAGYIRIEHRGGSARYYSLAPELLPDADSSFSDWGRCQSCKTEGEVLLRPSEWLRIPHDFYRKLARVCTHAEYLCVAVILTYTTRRPWQDAAAITIAEFQIGSGLSERTIQEALRSLENRGLISTRALPGKQSTYRATLENGRSQAARPARTICYARGSEHTAKLDSSVTPELPDKTASRGAAEFRPVKALGVCKSCWKLGLIELRTRPAVTSRPPDAAVATESPPGQGEQTAKLQPKPLPPIETREILGLAEYLEQWARQLGDIVSRSIVDRIALALFPARLAVFIQRCEVRREYILRAKSLGVLVPIAADCSAIEKRFIMQRDDAQKRQGAWRAEVN